MIGTSASDDEFDRFVDNLSDESDDSELDDVERGGYRKAAARGTLPGGKSPQRSMERSVFGRLEQARTMGSLRLGDSDKESSEVAMIESFGVRQP